MKNYLQNEYNLNNSKYSDNKPSANSVDQDQTSQNAASY